MRSLTRNAPPEKPALGRALLRWYARHQRPLPWRENPEPYRILVSEFMLQQTRVETVVPYFERFLKSFPSLPDLARAPLSRVLKAWAGLGYYARARNLHAAARTIVSDLNGKIPSRKAQLLALPGFGPYTAGAVASLAFHEPVAALDGNVKRVFSRLFPGAADPAGNAGRRRTEEALEKLIPPGRASHFNQALMDLGAAVCTPSRPRCPECPLGRFCPSRGAAARIRKAPPKLREETWVIALLEREGRYLLHRNESRGLLAGLWQFPAVVEKGGQGGSASRGREALIKHLRDSFGLQARARAALPHLEYSFTHIRARMKPFLCSLTGPLPRPGASKTVRWVRPSGLGRYPVSTAMRKIAALLPGRR